jgi:hypothetical protein
MGSIGALFPAAAKARLSAYAPSSGFAVEAALRTVSGAIFSAANVENAAYPIGTCAEAAAIAAMVAAGQRRIAEILIIGEGMPWSRLAVLAASACANSPPIEFVIGWQTVIGIPARCDPIRKARDLPQVLNEGQLFPCHGAVARPPCVAIPAAGDMFTIFVTPSTARG